MLIAMGISRIVLWHVWLKLESFAPGRGSMSSYAATDFEFGRRTIAKSTIFDCVGFSDRCAGVRLDGCTLAVVLHRVSSYERFDPYCYVQTGNTQCTGMLGLV